jgi:hypothetical protein
MDRPEGKRSRAAKRRKAPPGCYWRADTLWGKVVIQGKEFRWSLHTSDPGVAAQRRAEGKERAHSDAYHKSDIPRSLSEALVHWGKHLEREVENRNLSAKTEQRYLVSIGQLAPHALAAADTAANAMRTAHLDILTPGLIVRRPHR